ncbi:hypothetical protein GCM10010406_07030 [Streptomyces thermolineatus]|uniref:ANTAR domain-containing protein n=1 Tax=Streptomyces thermolineatus TaxID=44033 RepID=A0ABN3KX00_9ACTN
MVINRLTERLGRAIRGDVPPEPARPGAPSRQHNLFEAAAAYVAASAAGDDEAMASAESRVQPDALMFGVTELARRSLVALAHEHGTTPDLMARSLLGLKSGQQPRDRAGEGPSAGAAGPS